MESRQSLITPTFKLAFVANFVMALSFSNNALYPLYVTHEGGGPETIGLFMGAYSLAAVLGRPLIGFLIDRWGIKPVWLLGILGMALPSLGFYVLLGSGLTSPVWGLRVIQGLGFGAHFTAFFTLAGVAAPPGRRTESMAKFGLSGMIAHMVGPYIGEQIVHHQGVGAFLLTVSGFALASIVFVLFLPKSENLETPRELPSPGEFTRSLRSPGMRLAFMLAILLAVSYGTPSSFLAPVATHRGISGFGLYFTAFAITGTIIRLTGSHWGDKFGLRRVLLPGFILYTITLIILSAGHSLVWVVIAGAFGGLAHGIVFPAVVSLGYSLAPRAFRGTAMALVTGMMDFGAAMTAFSLGKIADFHGYEAVFPSGAVGPAIAVVIILASLLHKPAPVKTGPTDNNVI